MKAEAWIFGDLHRLLRCSSPRSYWFITGDPTGTAALTMTYLLAALVTFYLGFHAAKMEPRPEDRKDAEIADGAGELGLLPAVQLVAAVVRARASASSSSASRWSAGGCSSSASALGAVALCGWIYEYYRGEHAH